MLSITSNAQVTTYFYGRDKVQSKNETAALYSVAIYDNQTWVTIELIPTKNRSRMNYWTSRNTYIIVSNSMELPIIGFLDNNNEIDAAPFSGNWGWSNVKKDQKYHYTMVFAGKIPPGVTNFTLKDKGTYGGAHGYGFSNYTLNNPRTGATSWSEFSIKQNADSNNDGICGIYEGSDNTGYKLGCVKQNGEYRLIYLGSRERMAWWQIGDTKAVLRPSATNGFFKADWYMANKTLESNSYVVFDGGSMKTVIGSEETFYLKMYPTSSSNGISSATEKWSGTGFALNNGYIATNYHVVENAKSIKVQGIKGNFNIEYNAIVISTDKFNDLAIIKINDSRFNGFGAIPYRVKTSTSEVGEDVFVLGYPLTTTMGDEIKLTTGVISSKTGFQGDVSLYQISAPIQPGNSGGPLFDGNGNLIGIVNAKHRGAENVSYAIKASYLNNLVESASSISLLPTNNSVSGMSLSNKVKSLKNFVFMITCSSSSTGGSSYSGNITSSSNTISYPAVRSSTAERARIKSVTLGRDYTAVEIISNNQSGSSYYQWCNIDRNTYILVNGTRYTMTKAEGIKIAPDKTYFSYAGQDITFTLYFPSVPTSATSMDLIESADSEWKFYGIKIR
jgi:S1-C subfamily serine protease